MKTYFINEYGKKIPYNRMSKSQKVQYHKKKRDNAPYILATRPDVNINDVRVSAMYHHNCYLKNMGAKNYQRKNKTLFKWAVNYAVKYEDKPLYSVKRKHKKDYKI